MAERIKMPRGERAKQFAPFDALKGLKEALKIKEYEHDRIVRGDLGEDEIKEISAVLSDIQKNDFVEVEFFRDGHNINLQGKARLEASFGKLLVGCFEIDFDEIRKIKKIEKK